MHKLRYIKIDGFLDRNSPIELNLSDTANFIIGRNGTGKTTLINLISACLAADYAFLRDAKFLRVEMRFKEVGKREIPRIIIEKVDSDDVPNGVKYSIQSKSSASPEDFSPDALQYVMRRGPDGRPRRFLSGRMVAPLREKLGDIYSHTWLSLHRGPETFEFDEFEEENGAGNPVDRKLESVLGDLGRYFTRLDRQVADRTSDFQRSWFLSFLATDRSPRSIIPSDLDLVEEKEAVREIFKKFSMPPESYSTRLDRHVQLAERALKSLSNNNQIDFNNFLILYDISRLHLLVEQWQKLQARQAEIYSPRDEYVNIATEMLYRKKVKVDVSNEVVIETDAEDKIPKRKLSSGEKQLLIFLSETLLQERRSHIFLADEPELSLHVEWQEELVPNLFRMNPNAQVIFATHSPDIVGAFQKNVFNMEGLFS